MHTGPVPGDYTSDERPVPNAQCIRCRSTKVVYRSWESSDQAYDDTKYRCLDCNHTWWVESIDS